MSVVYKGKVLDSDLTKNANGGTEQMRSRLISNVDNDLLSKVAIHFSRPKELYNDVPNILYCHDLADDVAIHSLEQDANKYDCFVFVSYWQRDQFIHRFGLPHSKCTVIENAIETEFDPYIEKPTDTISFIYHTTPHRGLELVVPIFNRLCELYNNIHLDVFSSFGVYGWEQRDVPYEPLFQSIREHPHMTYHGAKSNQEVMSALKQSHIFLYPSIWKETSCIALIEAMNSGCFCIYPSYGALPETGSFKCNIGMYDYHEDLHMNANRALNVANLVLQNQATNTNYIQDVATRYTSGFPKYSIPVYKTKWDNLLKSITERN